MPTPKQKAPAEVLPTCDQCPNTNIQRRMRSTHHLLAPTVTKYLLSALISNERQPFPECGSKRVLMGIRFWVSQTMTVESLWPASAVTSHRLSSLATMAVIWLTLNGEGVSGWAKDIN